MRSRRTEPELLAHIFNRLSDIGLLVGTLSFVVLIVAWQKDWQHAYAWVFPASWAEPSG
ncbi:hypothetical protein CLV47_11820 [Antricoccus suffuscus]|uniref:Uncharacterized protein n=1 Tax=Antricoccus suffuscus TaxID=1629062 RepID=A0A2T0ZTH3_9ACTN|nr:hypothetical protein [Antricoccus suffuscus]PRZ39656.1 hypothetical protein CLV47_11820 [Antricoccus suffuscus]